MSDSESTESTESTDPAEPADPADPASRVSPSVIAALETLGRNVVQFDRLHGGTIANTVQLGLDDGSTVVLKRSRRAPEQAWAIEADGLDGLRVDGGPEIPRVLGFGDDFLLIEYFGETVPDDDAFWEIFGRQLAAMHSVTNDRFGWHRDNLLGAVDQPNSWMDDGWEFFGERRLLRYFELENVQAALTDEDRADFERVAARLPQLIPEQPASLVHGDLWRPNVLAASPTRPALCDPAVSYTWGEVDLSMLWCSGGVPDACFAAYQEVRPLVGDWQDRMPLLHLREQLSVLAHIAYDEATVTDIRATLKWFR